MANTKLHHGKGEAYLSFDNAPALIDISYRGKVDIYSNLGRNWIMQSNGSRVIFLSKTLDPIPSGKIILKYRGEFIPQQCKVVSWEKEVKVIELVGENIDRWNKTGLEWGTESIKWKDMSGDYRFGYRKKKKPLGRIDRKTKKRSSSGGSSGGSGSSGGGGY